MKFFHFPFFLFYYTRKYFKANIYIYIDEALIKFPPCIIGEKARGTQFDGVLLMSYMLIFCFVYFITIFWVFLNKKKVEDLFGWAIIGSDD